MITVVSSSRKSLLNPRDRKKSLSTGASQSCFLVLSFRPKGYTGPWCFYIIVLAFASFTGQIFTFIMKPVLGKISKT